MKRLNHQHEGPGRRIIAPLLALGMLMLPAAAMAQSERVTLNASGQPVSKVFREIEKQTPYTFVYRNNLITNDSKASVNCSGKPLSEVLKAMLEPMGLTYTLNNHTITITKHETKQTQAGKVSDNVKKRSITGQVVDENNEPMIGVTVSVKGTDVATMTNIDGRYSINTAPGETLSFTYIGYSPKQITVGDSKTIDVKMDENITALDEVVVVGFGVQKKSDLTGSVAQVNMKDVLGNRPVLNASTALQGAIPGLMITGGSSPGGERGINIRGDLSLNGGGPLVLIDNVEGNLSMLNPDDIESVTVLKDASASAIYGARAAGGVVLVTTKRPASDAHFNLTYGFTQGWSKSINRPEQAPLLDYIQAYRDANFSKQFWAGDGDLDTWTELIKQYRSGELEGVLDNGIYKHTDNRVYYLKESDVQGSILTTGALSNHNIAMSGGTERIRFRLSANYSRENGPVITDKDLYVRKTISSFVSGDVTKWFTQELSMFYTDRRKRALATNIRNPYDTQQPSWYPVKGYMPGEYISSDEDLIMDSPYNSYLVSPTSTTINSVPRIQVKSILKPIKNWTITGEYTYNQNNYNYKAYTDIIKFANAQLLYRTNPLDPTKDRYTINTATTKYSALNLYTNYLLNIGKHHFTAMFGFNQEKSNYEELNTAIEGQAVPSVPSFGGGTGEKFITESYSEYTIRGGFGRLTYNFDERYLLSLSGRYDGSSKFPKGNRFGFFPSVSAAWRISNEKFMEGTRGWLDELKPRFSYGSIGNQAISPYGFVANMGINKSTTWLDQDDRVTLIGVPGLVRANYTWETVKTFNYGIDLRMLNARLQGSFEWYRRNTSGMLAAGAELPSTVGASAPLQNIADMRTDGWEVAVSWRDRVGDWSYRLGFNIYDHQSKITKYNNKTGSLSTWYAGRDLNQIWGYTADGYYSIDDFEEDLARKGTWQLKEGIPSIQGYNVRPGDMRFKDLNGDGIINDGTNTYDDHGDIRVLGNSTVRMQFGINGGLSWKGLNLDFILQGAGKRDYWLNGASIFPFSGSGGGYFYTLYYNQTDYWRPKSTDPGSPDFMVAENPDSHLFRIYDQLGNAGSNTRKCDKYLQNASYLRIKNITLGYTVPAQLTKKVLVQQFRIFGSVENLHTFTSLPKGYDPENMSWTYPFYRTWSVGATITF